MQNYKRFLDQLSTTFCFLAIIFTPFISHSQTKFTTFLFEKIVLLIQNLLFPNALKVVDFSSDTIGLNILLILLLFIALLFSVYEILTQKKNRISSYFRQIIIYYLFFVLLKYGFDKLFKTQFYLPEPNILYSQFGDLTKDTLYWSTIGTSRFYNIATGLIEISTAILILFTRTRFLGLLMAIAVFTHIVIINFGFDISVKTFSTLLLISTFTGISPNLTRIYDLFNAEPSNNKLENKPLIKNKSWIYGLKWALSFTLFFIVLFPYWQTSNYNDDKQPRPFLHGAYQVISTIKNSKELERRNFQHERVFFHRQNFVIFQLTDHQMVDYHYTIDQEKKQLKIQDYQLKTYPINYQYSTIDSILTLTFPQQKLVIISKALNWKTLPALKNENHLTIDEIK